MKVKYTLYFHMMNEETIGKDDIESQAEVDNLISKLGDPNYIFDGTAGCRGTLYFRSDKVLFIEVCEEFNKYHEE